MRRTKQLLAAAVLASSFVFTACSGASSAETVAETAEVTASPAAESETLEAKKDGKILIAYFSVMETDGVDTVSGASRVAVNGGVQGNVEYMANTIAQATGGTMFRIDTVQKYPTVHKPLVNQAEQEQNRNARPELSAHIANLDDYDVIFVGYPIWWSEMPMAMYSFFDEYDFSGKTIIPFSSHGGSGFSGTPDEIRRLEPGANVLNGYTVERNDVSGERDDLINWVNSLELQ